MKLTDKITTISGIGPMLSKKLEKLEIFTVFDLLHHLPFRYEDRRIITPIKQIVSGNTITVVGVVSEITNEYTKSGKVIQKAEIGDDSGKILVIWFNQRYLARTVQAGTRVSLYGKADWFGRKLAIISPEIADTDLAGTIVPIYPETAGLTSKWLRKKIREVLDLKLLDESLSVSLRGVHFPNELYEVEKYRRNLAFNELLKFETENLKRRHDWQNRGTSHQFTNPKSQVIKFISDLPFRLTKSQNMVIEEILTDLEKPVAMNRLLEGDVGSGKTVVAAVACLVSNLNGFKSLFMAPTQILALQHFETLSKLMSPFNISVGLVTSQSKSTGDVLVGTQALLNNDIDNVGLVIIDEQHKFGVAQRALLQHKGGTPHVLTMTATPIPRTMALVLYGDLDLSQLTELPVGRKTIKTWVVPEEKRTAAIKWINDQMIKYASQAFWVCSLIDESESLGAIRAVNVEFESLKKSFSNLNLGLLHGRMKNKDEIINKFRDKEIDILVSTPVVEVGIDIPDASIMVIEDAHRFGLAALHQLRGRVGRNGQQAYCLMFSTQDTERLKAMETTHIGSRLAEIDLAIRGAGNIYSTSQHGKSELKIATYKDFDMLPKVREVVLKYKT
ncbi:MAG: ATP-dependent DNA helicase RecG [Candidatus Amesbacteria bacterium]|nr:ATP-dependent DNA helicase RecG [Candidatus Amesbacteria bacterium]